MQIIVNKVSPHISHSIPRMWCRGHYVVRGDGKLDEAKRWSSLNNNKKALEAAGMDDHHPAG